MTKSYWRFFFGVLIIGVCLLVGGSKVFQDFFTMIFGEGEGNYPIFQIASHHQRKIVLVLLAVFFSIIIYIYIPLKSTNQPTSQPTDPLSVNYLP